MPTKDLKQNIQNIESSINNKAAKYNIFKRWKPLRKLSQVVLKYSLATTASNTAKKWYADLIKLDKSYSQLKSLKENLKKNTPKMSLFGASHGEDYKKISRSKNLNKHLGRLTPNNSPSKTTKSTKGLNGKF